MDQAYSMEQHYIRGHFKMQLRVSWVMVIMIVLAWAHVAARRDEQMRSLLQPVLITDTGPLQPVKLSVMFIRATPLRVERVY